MTKKRNLNNPSGKFSVEVICVTVGTRLRSNFSKNSSIYIKLEQREIRKRTLKDMLVTTGLLRETRKT